MIFKLKKADIVSWKINEDQKKNQNQILKVKYQFKYGKDKINWVLSVAKIWFLFYYIYAYFIIYINNIKDEYKNDKWSYCFFIYLELEYGKLWKSLEII